VAGSGVDVTTGVSAPSVKVHVPAAPWTTVSVVNAPPSNPTSEIVSISSNNKSPAESGTRSSTSVGRNLGDVTEVKGPTVGDSPPILMSAEIAVPAVVSITMMPPSVQPDPEHDTLGPAYRLPDTSNVTSSARATPATAPNSTTRMIHKDFCIFQIPPRRARGQRSDTCQGLAFTRTIVADIAILKRHDLLTPGTGHTANNCRS